MTVVFKYHFSNGGERDVECPIYHKPYHESKSLLRFPLRTSSGKGYKNALIVSFLVVDLGSGDNNVNRQFV